MSDLNLTSFNPLYPMRVHQYDELFNDQNQGVPDKINSIIDYLNKVGKLTNDVVKDWNTVYQWVMNDGLTTDVNNKLEAMLANHEFDSIIDALATKVGDLNTLTTTAKDTIVNAINSLQTAVTNNTTNIATNTANIATNTANIVTNTTNIASNTSALAQNTSQLANISIPVESYVSSVVNGDWAPAFMAAHNALPANGGTISFSQDVTIKSAVSFSKQVTLIGKGYSTLNGRHPKATIYKTGNFDGISFTYPGSVIKDVHIEGTTGNGGNGINILNGMCLLQNVSSSLHGGDGIRIGGTNSQNCNMWRAINIFTFNNGGHGFHIEDTAQPTLPNNNAGFLMGLDTTNNGGDGLYCQNSADNGFYSVCAQVNTGVGIHFGSHSSGHHVFNSYTESNTAGDITLDSGSTQNYVWGYRAVNNDNIVDNGTGNFVMGRDSQYNYLPYFKSPFTTNGFNIQNLAISGVWNFAKDGTTRDLVLQLLGTTASAKIRLNGGSGQTINTTVDNITINTGTTIKNHFSTIGTLNFGTSVPGSSAVTTTRTITGVNPGDMVTATPTSGTIEAGLVWNAYVSSANTVTIRLTNITTSAVTIVSQGWRVDAWVH